MRLAWAAGSSICTDVTLLYYQLITRKYLPDSATQRVLRWRLEGGVQKANVWTAFCSWRRRRCAGTQGSQNNKK